MFEWNLLIKWSSVFRYWVWLLLLFGLNTAHYNGLFIIDVLIDHEILAHAFYRVCITVMYFKSS
jgi:hypothetical protein